MATPNIEQLVAFGPFRIPHLQAQVDDRMRHAFYSYLVEKVLPLLEGKITRIDGRFHSHYDQPQFADLTEVRHRYYYEVKLFSTGGLRTGLGRAGLRSAHGCLHP